MKACLKLLMMAVLPLFAASYGLYGQSSDLPYKTETMNDGAVCYWFDIELETSCYKGLQGKMGFFCKGNSCHLFVSIYGQNDYICRRVDEMLPLTKGSITGAHHNPLFHHDVRLINGITANAPADAVSLTAVFKDLSDDELVKLLEGVGEISLDKNVAEGIPFVDITTTVGPIIQAMPFMKELKAVGAAVDLGLSVKWMDRNLGAFAVSGIGKEYTYEAALTAAREYANQNGYGWRLPTSAERDELLKKCIWVWQNSPEGYLVEGPNGKSIFLPTTYSDTEKVRSGGSWCREEYSSSQSYILWYRKGFKMNNENTNKISNKSVEWSTRLVYDR